MVIKPKVWPKEYTFEEFKMLNPNIKENILINYYNKYLQEYAEDRSRHIKHFNDTKNNLSEEIRFLKRGKGWTYDGDQVVGPYGAGRVFRSPLNPNVNALHFDGVDDVVPLNFIQEGRIPADGTLKPYKGLTFAMWINTSYIQSSSDTSALTYTIGGAFDSQTGYVFNHQNHSLQFSMIHDANHPNSNHPTTNHQNGDLIHCRSQYRWCQDNGVDTKQQFREDGWHHIIGTWDGKKQILYIDGNEANADGKLPSPTFNNTLHTWDVYSGGGSVGAKVYGGRGVGFSRIEQSFNVGSGTGDGYPDLLSPTDYQTTSGSIGSIYYREESPNSGYRNNHLVNVSIGQISDTDVNGAFSGYTGTTYSGSIAEVAIWDEALDATTINELWHNGISGSAPKFDLSHPGHLGDPNHPYDLIDEGLSYKNVGRYAGSLQGWWRLEEGTGVIAYDSSGKNRNGELINSPEWDPEGSFTPSLTQGNPS